MCERHDDRVVKELSNEPTDVVVIVLVTRLLYLLLLLLLLAGRRRGGHGRRASAVDEDQVIVDFLESLVCFLDIVTAFDGVAAVESRILQRDYMRILACKHEQELGNTYKFRFTHLTTFT